MTNHYLLKIEQGGAQLKLSYRAGRFFRLERISGRLSKEQLMRIGYILPYREDEIADINKLYKGKLCYRKIVKEKSLYSQFAEEWFAFYERLMGVQYRFNGADGKALKSIISYLKAITGDEAQALALWQALLSSWDKLDDFYKNNADLKFINSQLNKILNHVKRINKTGNGGLNAAYLEGIKRDLGAG